MGRLNASVSVTFVFAGSIEDAVSRSIKADIDAFEFQVIDAATAALHAPIIAAAGLRTALINLDVGDFAAGGAGLSAIPSRQHDFVTALADGVEVARMLRPDIVHIGPSRVPFGVDPHDCRSQLADNIRRARDALAPLGCRISIEVLNAVDYPGLAVDSVERAIALLDRIGGEGLALQYDIYHAAVDGRDIVADIAALHPLIGHVQFADYPGRAEPGTGRLDLAACFTALRAVGYAGYVGAEYRPTGTDDFAWLALL